MEPGFLSDWPAPFERCEERHLGGVDLRLGLLVGFVRWRVRLNGRTAPKMPYVCVLIWPGGVAGYPWFAFCLVDRLSLQRGTLLGELKRKHARFFAGSRLTAQSVGIFAMG